VTDPGSRLRDCAAVAFLYRLLPPRPTFAQDMSAAEADVMQRHVSYWQDLLNRDAALAFGAIGEGDPAVESGTCTYEVVPMQLVRPG